MTYEPIRLGAVGLGRGFALTARALANHSGIHLVAGATRSAAARQAFSDAFDGPVGARAFKTLDELLADENIEMVYVATPHEFHCEHVCACLQAGKHVVVEKPMAIAIEDAETMVTLAKKSGLHLLVGPSHSYDPPIALAAELIASGRFGRPRLLHGIMATDFLYRPRRDEELHTALGGGVIFSQAVHHADVAMRLMGSVPESVYARTGVWNKSRATEGAYTAMLSFPDDATANLTYSGYGYFDSDIWMDNISELGVEKESATSGRAQQALGKITDEAQAKTKRAFSGLNGLPNALAHEHFGPIVVFCEQGDLRVTPHGVTCYTVDGEEQHIAPFEGPRQAFAQALVDVLRNQGSPVQTGEWGINSLRVCHAMLQSAKDKVSINLNESQHA